MTKCMPMWEAKTIYAVLDDVYVLTRDINMELSHLVQNWTSQSGLADLFLDTIHVLFAPTWFE